MRWPRKPQWTVDGLIIGSTILATLGEIVLNFITSYGHIFLLGGKYGEKGIDGALTPIIIDFALFAFAMLNLFLARKGRYIEVKKRNGRVKRKPEFRWPRWVLAFGVGCTVGANTAYGMWFGYTGAFIAAFAALMLFFTIEGAMLMLRVAAEERDKKAAKAKVDPDLEYGRRTVNEIRARHGMPDNWMTYPAPAFNEAEPSEGDPSPELAGKAQEPGLTLPSWRQAVNGQGS